MPIGEGFPDSPSSAFSNGCFIRLLSKSLIFYEGTLFHVNVEDSIIGLKNVRRFGTEEGKGDNQQAIPSDTVCDYMHFSRDDIEDIWVDLMPRIPHDPSIAQCHYSYPAAFTSAVPENPNASGLPEPTYWPGLIESSGPPSQPQPSRLATPGSPVSPPVQQHHLKYPSTSSFLPSGPSDFDEFPHPLPSPDNIDSLDLTATLVPPAAFLSNSPIGPGSSASMFSSNLMQNNALAALPTGLLPSTSGLVYPLCTTLYTEATRPPVAEKLDSVLTLPYQNMSQSVPPIIATSIANHIEGTMPSLLPSACSMETAHKDIELVQPAVSVPSLVTTAELLQSMPIVLSSASSLPQDIEAVQASILKSDSSNRDALVTMLPIASPKLLPLPSQELLAVPSPELNAVPSPAAEKPSYPEDYLFDSLYHEPEGGIAISFADPMNLDAETFGEF